MSTALPDLEMDDEINTKHVDPVTVSNIPMQRTQSLILGSEQEEKPVIVDSTAEVLAIREEVLKEMEERKQQIKDTKGTWLRHTKTCHIFLIIFSLDTEQADDCGWVWCDGLSTDIGSCGWGTVATSLHVSKNLHYIDSSSLFLSSYEYVMIASLV